MRKFVSMLGLMAVLSMLVTAAMADVLPLPSLSLLPVSGESQVCPENSMATAGVCSSTLPIHSGFPGYNGNHIDWRVQTGIAFDTGLPIAPEFFHAGTGGKIGFFAPGPVPPSLMGRFVYLYVAENTSAKTTMVSGTDMVSFHVDIPDLSTVLSAGVIGTAAKPGNCSAANNCSASATAGHHDALDFATPGLHPANRPLLGHPGTDDDTSKTGDELPTNGSASPPSGGCPNHSDLCTVGTVAGDMPNDQTISTSQSSPFGTPDEGSIFWEFRKPSGDQTITLYIIGTQPPVYSDAHMDSLRGTTWGSVNTGGQQVPVPAAAVPEPGTWTLFGLGLLALGVSRWRWRRS